MGGIGGAPIKKMGVFFFFFYSVQGVGEAAAEEAPYKKMGVQMSFFLLSFLQLSRGPEGPSRWPKATSPL